MSRIVLTLCLSTLAVTSFPVDSAFAQARKKAAAKKAAAKKKAPPKPKINLPLEAARTDIKIAPVDPSQRTQALRSAAIIEGIIERGLKKAGMEPNLLVPDEASSSTSPERFPRRVRIARSWLPARPINARF